MDSALDMEILDVQRQLDAARRERAGRQASLDSAKALEASALKELSDLGLNPETASAAVEKLDAQIADQVRSIRDKLQETT